MPGRVRFIHGYDSIISIENLLSAWNEFLKGKRNKADVRTFQMTLSDNIWHLHKDLAGKSYEHGKYVAFNINDPKPRNIHKAPVRDRLLHHAVYRKLYPFFDRTFIADSYSCRRNKGTHRALNRFAEFGIKASRNNTMTCWMLKCDIRKFFAFVDQAILIDILKRYILDEDIVRLLIKIISSFHSTAVGVGLPLGNLTSQLLVNIYMNEFDQHMKHKLKAEYYIRYADDFVVFSKDRARLMDLIPKIEDFLWNRLKLRPHPDKVSIRTLASGVDFLGWIHFTDHRVLRTATKKRMLKILYNDPKPEFIASYLGMLKHGNAFALAEEIMYHTYS